MGDGDCASSLARGMSLERSPCQEVQKAKIFQELAIRVTAEFNRQRPSPWTSFHFVLSPLLKGEFLSAAYENPLNLNNLGLPKITIAFWTAPKPFDYAVTS